MRSNRCGDLMCAASHPFAKSANGWGTEFLWLAREGASGR